MPISENTLAQVRGHDYVTHFAAEHNASMILWLLDDEDRIADITTLGASYWQRDRESMVGLHAYSLWPSSKAQELLLENARVRSTGQPSTMYEWLHLPQGWRKFVLTKNRFGTEFLLGIAHDITDSDPMAGWLNRLDLGSGRLYLGEDYHGQFLTMREYLVLHRLSRNRSHQDIADELHITTDTVRYRVNRVRDKFGVFTIRELWEEVYASGLVHLLALPLDARAVPRDEDQMSALLPSRREKTR